MVSSIRRSMHSTQHCTAYTVLFRFFFGVRPFGNGSFFHFLSEGDNGPTVHWKSFCGGFSPLNLLHFRQCCFACCFVSHCLMFSVLSLSLSRLNEGLFCSNHTYSIPSYTPFHVCIFHLFSDFYYASLWVFFMPSHHHNLNLP